MWSISDITRFLTLFKSNRSNYGVSELGQIVDGKQEANSHLIYAEATPAIFEKHLKGEGSGIGLSPITEAFRCFWGAIDVDIISPGLLQHIVKAIYEYSMPLLPFYSKSLHLHMFLFASEGMSPKEMRDLLTEYRIMFGLPATTEIFPKQIDKRTTNTYSWINLPYYDAVSDSPARKLIKSDMTTASFDEALSYMELKNLTNNDHKAFMETMPYKDAPPCIQTGCILHDVPKGYRNNFLYSVSVYLRMRDENGDIEGQLIDIASKLDDPVGEEELQNTVLKAIHKNSYFYKCSEMQGCNKALCRQREFGIESNASSGLEYGEMTQYNVDPPYYTWQINGQLLHFYSEAEILKQDKFRELCYRYLHKVPRKLKDDQWTHILNRASEHIIIKDEGIDTGTGFSSGSQFIENTLKFFSEKRIVKDPGAISLGRVFEDTEHNKYLFDARSFIGFVKTVCDFKVYSPIELQTKLQELGAEPNGQYWSIDISIIKNKQKEVKKPQANVDFHDIEEQGTKF